jgi:hypothetical protein
MGIWRHRQEEVERGYRGIRGCVEGEEEEYFTLGVVAVVAGRGYTKPCTRWGRTGVGEGGALASVRLGLAQTGYYPSP